MIYISVAKKIEKNKVINETNHNYVLPTMNDTFEQLEKILYTVIPYVMFIDKNLVVYIPIMILSLQIIKYLTGKVVYWFFSDHEYKIFETDCAGNIFIHTQRNLYYDYVTFLLDKHNLLEKMKKIECNTYTVLNGEKKHNTGYRAIDYDITPKISPSSSEKIQFKYDGIDVCIQSWMETNTKKADDISTPTTTTNKKYYSITSPSYSNIKLFLQYINEIRIQFHETDINEDVYKYFTFYKGEWIRHTINVNKTIENIFLEKNKKSYIIDNINSFVGGKDLYDRYGMSRKISFLLYGLPGNGKSSLVYAIAKSYSKKIYKLSLDVKKEAFMKQVHMCTDNSIILIEDIDTIAISHDREAIDTDKPDKKEKSDELKLADILEILDGYCYFNECIVFMTTNYVDKLDPALIRSGRMDHKIEFENANSEQIGQIIKYFFNRNISKKISRKITLSISVAELINTIIIPHLNDYTYVIDYLTTQ